jgi:hypothetical protein
MRSRLHQARCLRRSRSSGASPEHSYSACSRRMDSAGMSDLPLPRWRSYQTFHGPLSFFCLSTRRFMATSRSDCPWLKRLILGGVSQKKEQFSTCESPVQIKSLPSFWCWGPHWVEFFAAGTFDRDVSVGKPRSIVPVTRSGRITGNTECMVRRRRASEK